MAHADISSIGDPLVHHVCHQAGETCTKVKRAAEAIANAIAEPVPAPQPGAEAAHRICFGSGELCIKHKRALDSLSGIVNKMR